MTRGFVGARWLVVCLALVASGLLAAPAAASADTLTPSGNIVQLNATEGQPLAGVAVGNFFDSVGDDAASDYTASINWGDGGTTGGTISGSSGSQGPWTVRGSHTYAEEGGYVITVTVTDTPSSASASWQIPVSAADAGLSLPAGSATQIAGAGSSASGAMRSFEGAIGGSDNGTTPGEQNGGFRHITWDDVSLNGSDPGSTTIRSNHVVSIAPTREQPWGIGLGRGVAVADDGFTSVNSSVAGRFAPFSSPNVFAPFNTNRIQMQIVSPAAQASGTASAATRGLGIVFLNVWQPNTTSIQYFSGTTLLTTAYAPAAAGPGQPSFVGVVFPSPAVTQVVITMGSAAIFSFDGRSVTPGPADSPPSGTNLVAADDVVLAEPANTQTTITGTAGVPVSGVVGLFSDTDPNATASDYSAVVNWGDHSQYGAPVSGSGGTFSVTSSHTYMIQGTFQVATTVTDFGGSTQTNHVTIQIAQRSSATRVACSPSAVTVTNATTCTATASDVGAGTSIAPTGQVGFTSPTAGVSFSNDEGCFLKRTSRPGQSKCSVTLIPGHFPPKKATIVANYNGDAAHSGSTGSGKVTVRAQTCSVKLVSRRLARSARRLPVFITCKMPADLRITVIAVRTRGRRITFAHLKTSVRPNRRTKIRIPISNAGVRALRTGPKRQRMSLKITVLATVRSQPVKIHVTVRGVKVS